MTVVGVRLPPPPLQTLLSISFHQWINLFDDQLLLFANEKNRSLLKKNERFQLQKKTQILTRKVERKVVSANVRCVRAAAPAELVESCRMRFFSLRRRLFFLNVFSIIVYLLFIIVIESIWCNTGFETNPMKSTWRRCWPTELKWNTSSCTTISFMSVQKELAVKLNYYPKPLKAQDHAASARMDSISGDRLTVFFKIESRNKLMIWYIWYLSKTSSKDVTNGPH